MGALHALSLSVLPLPEPTPPQPRRVRRFEPSICEGPDCAADPSASRYHVIKRSGAGRGDRCSVLCDCWGVKELEAVVNLPPRFPWFNDTVGAVIDIERWSPSDGSWALCNDPRFAQD